MLQRQMGPRQGRMPGPPRGMRGPSGFGGGGGPGFGPQQMRGARGGQGQGGGGILSRLFQRSAPSQAGNAISGFSRASTGGSAVQGVANPTTISSFLSNTQQVLKTAQQVGPMFQQYAPMVKNIPAMWKIYQGFKDSSTNEDSDIKTTEANVSIESTSLTDREPDQDLDPDHEYGDRTRESVPKLYV